MNDNTTNKNYFSDSDKKSKNINQNKIKNLLLNLDENNFQGPISYLKKLPKLKRHTQTNSNDSINFNGTDNIINLLNNMSGEKKNKIKVNNNKYNIKSNISEKNLEKFFKNMKMKNKNNNNKNELKINNNIFTKRIRPFSSPGIKNKEIQNISSERRKLSFDKDKSIKLHYKNNSLFNSDFIFNSSNSLNSKKGKYKNKITKKILLDSDIDFNINQINVFRKSTKNSVSNLINPKISNHITHRNSQLKNLPLSLSYNKNLDNLQKTKRKSLPLNSPIIHNSNFIKNNDEKENSILQNIKSDLSGFFSDRIRTNPNLKPIIRINERKGTVFGKKLGKKCIKSIYEKLKKNKENNSKSKFTYVINKNDVNIKNNIVENIKEIEQKYVRTPIQQKFIKKELLKIESKLINIKHNKNIIYSECIISKINSFYVFLAEKEKILLKRVVNNNFEEKEKTLFKIFKYCFIDFNKKNQFKFLYIVYKLYYSKIKRIIRTLFSISFPFLLDKYLNPRKGMLTLIFTFGIEKKIIVFKKAIKTILKNCATHQPSQFTNSFSSFNISDKKSQNLENKKINSNQELINKKLDNKDRNKTLLIKKKKEFFIPEKKNIFEKNRLQKIKNLLDLANSREENILYINEFVQSDTKFVIRKKSKIKIRYQKTFKIGYIYQKSTIKISKNNLSVKKLKKSNKQKILNSEYDENQMRELLSTQKILNDNLTGNYLLKRKKTKYSQKKITKIKIINNIFSSTNKDITKIKTDMIKASILKGIEHNLYKVIFYYIKEENLMLIEKYILDNYGFININYRDENGSTFLNMAVKHNCKKQIIQFLLLKGCNPNIPDVSF
jgi:hypothetical protein